MPADLLGMLYNFRRWVTRVVRFFARDLFSSTLSLSFPLFLSIFSGLSRSSLFSSLVFSLHFPALFSGFFFLLRRSICSMVIEQSMKWAAQRKVFGKPLMAQPVIRNKLANMIGQLEACQSWLETLTYQMVRMSYQEQVVKLVRFYSLCFSCFFFFFFCVVLRLFSSLKCN